MRQHREFVEGYHLKYHALSGANGFTLETVLGSTNKIITGLQPNTDYAITVQPFNSRFNGPESNARSITTLRQGEARPCPGSREVGQTRPDTSSRP